MSTNLFSSTVEYSFLDGRLVLSIEVPDRRRIAWGLEIIDRCQSAVGDNAALNKLLFVEIPDRLAQWVSSASLDGRVVSDGDWREQLAQMPYLSGRDGLHIVQDLCFRNYLAIAGDGAP